MIIDETVKKDVELHMDILTIHSVQNAISWARLAWIAGLIVMFALAAGIYNEYWGFTRDLIERRYLTKKIIAADLCGKGEDEIAATLNKYRFSGSPQIEAGKVKFFKLAEAGHNRYLENIAQYCKDYTSIRGDKNDPSGSVAPNEDGPRETKLAVLKSEFLKHIDSEIVGLKQAQSELDVVTLPGVSIQAGGSDIGILGSLALLIVGIWLSANLLNERDALIQLLSAQRNRDGSWELNLERSSLSRNSLKRAYEIISNTFVFTHVEFDHRLFQIFGVISFLAPVGLIAMTVILDFLTLRDVGEFGVGLMSWHLGRWVLSVLLMLVVSAVWFYCLFLNRTTTGIMHRWSKKLLAEEKEGPENAMIAFAKYSWRLPRR